MEVDQYTLRNPFDAYPRPEFPDQPQNHPGTTVQMEPRPDHGEGTYRGSGRLSGRSALITGGDSGIGRAVALAYAREGADVLISYLDEDVDARETIALIEAAGCKGVAVAGDITTHVHCVALIDAAVSAFGKLDILVNNAAYQMERPGIDAISSEELDRTLKTNVYAMFCLCKAAVAIMPPGASIINTTSVQASKPTPSLLAYATTKGAIVTFKQALAQETIERGIRVDCVAPGPVWTPLIPATMEPEVRSFGSQAPIGRPAQPAELAPAYVFLASQESSTITGARLAGSGGTPVP